MPAVKYSHPDAPIEQRAANTDISASVSGVVGTMHELIEQRMAKNAMSANALDRSVETLSRWAAYPALLIAAVAIGSGIMALLS